MAVRRNIQYLNKDFTELRASLINYARTYFPTTYNDFSPSSPGMMFMEMAAYVGDVLSFYLDNQIQENFLQYARQTNNLYELAYMFGYKPNVTQVATVDVDFYQQVPKTFLNTPDFDYSLYVPENTSVVSSSSGSVSFVIQNSVDFSVSSSGDPTEVTVYSVDGNGNPVYFLLKKTRKAISSTINTTTFNFTTPEQFATVEITANNIVGILDIIDSDGNTWYEVNYLAQDTVFDSIKNTNVNDPNLSQYQGDTPYLLQLKGVQRRFTTRFLNNTTLQLQFGAGTSADTDEEILPNPDNVGLGLPFEKDKLTTAFSPSNFVFTKTYGIAPSNTTLTVRYLTGGGVSANVPANTINQISAGAVQFLNTNLTQPTADTIFNSLAVNNPAAADGGGDGDTTEELRQNASSNFATQLRNVTQDDYLVRALSLPAKYGVISKAYIEPTKAQSVASGAAASILDLYVLSFDNESKLRTASVALKQNLSTYLSQYRMVNDSISIKDAFIVNIGVNFDIIVLPNFNSNEVLTRCILAMQDFFAIKNWQINEPIILRDVFVVLDNVEGVQTVKNLIFSNKVGTALGYSQFAYDITGATLNGVIYPSLDPMIFEVKYPNTDIQGRVVNL
jgi:phage-related baseplate assembly protein